MATDDGRCFIEIYIYIHTILTNRSNRSMHPCIYIIYTCLQLYPLLNDPISHSTHTISGIFLFNYKKFEFLQHQC